MGFASGDEDGAGVGVSVGFWRAGWCWLQCNDRLSTQGRCWRDRGDVATAAVKAGAGHCPRLVHRLLHEMTPNPKRRAQMLPALSRRFPCPIDYGERHPRQSFTAGTPI